MGKLSAFLRPAPAGRTKEVFLDRFTDEKGNVVPIIVKCVTPEENKKISQKCSGGVVWDPRPAKTESMCVYHRYNTLVTRPFSV